jgi:Mg2+ and Co2+ transporter CorA
MKEKEQQRQRADDQLSMSVYQIKMLKAQELIARRTKRDNSVMKVIAVLTSLFLPGAFIAVSLSFLLYEMC